MSCHVFVQFSTEEECAAAAKGLDAFPLGEHVAKAEVSTTVTEEIILKKTTSSRRTRTRTKKPRQDFGDDSVFCRLATGINGKMVAEALGEETDYIMSKSNRSGPFAFLRFKDKAVAEKVLAMSVEIEGETITFEKPKRASEVEAAALNPKEDIEVSDQVAKGVVDPAVGVGAESFGF
ncbi:hypothetical protein KIPB_010021 [Kipferlia bialata]|uniref:Uncharacterized protein n=1 Tax=Kipferlia bialata TaxID=797122 RepID=A0A9K3D342_9EUKA|nr:hypothetical protein KIPB_010021 [Kipferlia bialata]|eukprot:g10021.t1